MAEVEEIFKKILAMRGVEGVVILSCEGIPIRTSYGPANTVSIAGNILSLVQKAARVVKELDITNELIFLRLHSKLNECMVSVDPDGKYMMVVVQKSDKSDVKCI